MHFHPCLVNVAKHVIIAHRVKMCFALLVTTIKVLVLLDAVSLITIMDIAIYIMGVYAHFID